jgi:hypothetical protein
LKNKGFNEIYLQGHSSGANKVVYYLSQESSQKIKGTILLSPCDDIGLQIENLGEKYDNMLDIARVLIKEGNENSLMPEGSFYSYPISAKTYLNFFGPNSPIDTFPYRDPTREFKNLQKIETPILALFGNNGEYVIDNIAETLDLLEMKAGSCPSFTKIILDGATHNYLGKENKLADILIDWITKQ